MKIAIFSDSHDNLYNTQKALEIIKEMGITQGFHLGDFCAPPLIDLLSSDSSIHWTTVWGNVDGARAQSVLRFKDRANLDLHHETFREVELIAGVKIFLTHYPLLAQNAAYSGKYRACFYGDDHTKFSEVLSNGTLLANPGELVGTKTGQASFGIWNTDDNTFEFVDLRDFKVAR